MEAIAIYAAYVTLATVFIIVLLLLHELGVLKKAGVYIDLIYLNIITHPKLDKALHKLGELFMIVGGGVLGADAYSYITLGSMSFKAIVSGLFMVLGGMYITDKKDK